MKKIYLSLLLSIFSLLSFSQTVIIGGQCIGGGVTLTLAGTEAGKPYYEATGTVFGQAGTVIQVYWMAAPDNLWVIAFDGQPYFQNACNTAQVPGTSPNICQWTAVPGQTCTGGSALSVSGTGVVLPVTLTNFIATAAGSKVLLQWKTQQESNNKGFHIEHSSDGQQWASIGFVNGAGNSSTLSSYNFTDDAPATGLNFYRLRQEDFDGKTSYSDIVTATISAGRFFTISDNPGNGIYKLNFTASTNELIELQVIDAAGKVLLNKRTMLRNEIIDISRNAPGVYWLRVKKGKEQTGLKLIKL
ncbi:MAG: T9SS type A sorting domain-containing protein [Sphingobacteriales bacterium]|nr:MAG: T9SS type A sorting domain-containing protein [Sphingobacteriales bacterium]